MKQRFLAFGFVSLAALGGCVSSPPIAYNRPNTTGAEFTRDRARCILTAKSLMGPRPHYSMNMDLGDVGLNLLGTAGDLEDAEGNFRLCMQAEGYSEVP